MERKLTSQEKVAEIYRRHGVVIFIVNDCGEILTVQENEDKDTTGKRKGEIGVVCETSEKGKPWFDTVTRGLKEELGLNEVKQKSLLSLHDNSYLGETIFIEGVLARVVVLKARRPDILLQHLRPEGEVDGLGFRKPADLLGDNLRQGVRNVLTECLSDKSLNQNSSNFFPVSQAKLRSLEQG